MVWAYAMPRVDAAVCTCAGGLLNELREGQVEGAVVMRGPSTFGLPPKVAPGSILRRQVRQGNQSTLLSPPWPTKQLVYNNGTSCVPWKRSLVP